MSIQLAREEILMDVHKYGSSQCGQLRGSIWQPINIPNTNGRETFALNCRFQQFSLVLYIQILLFLALRQYALNKTHQCMYCLFMTIRCKTLSAPMITFISSPPESQDQWKYCLLDKLRYFQVKVKVTFLWLEIVHYLKWIKQEIHCNSSSLPFSEVKVLTSEPGKGELERRSGWKAR